MISDKIEKLVSEIIINNDNDIVDIDRTIIVDID